MTARRHSIRFLLLALVLALALPLVALTAYNLWERAQVRRAEAGAHAEDVAQLVAQNTDQLLKDSLDVLAPLSRLPLFLNPAELNCDHVRPFLPQPDGVFLDAAVVDSSGRAVCFTGETAEEIHVRDRAYFKQLLAGAPSAVSEPVRSRISARWVVVVAQPVRNARGELRGALLLAMDLLRFSQRFAARLNLPDNAVVAVVAERRLVVARSDAPEQWVGRSIEGTALQSFLRAAGPPRSIEGLDERMRLYRRASLRRMDWQVVVGIPYETLFGPVERQLQRSLWVTLLAGVGISLLAALLAERIVGPMRRLAGVARSYGRGGEPEPLAETGPSELRELARTFNAMVLERQRVGESLRQSEERFRSTFARAGVGLAHVGHDGRVLRCNPQMAEILGYPQSEIEHSPLSERVRGADGSAVLADIQAVFDNRAERSQREYLLRGPNGATWMRLTLSAAGAGDARHVIAVAEDITSLREAEARERQDAQTFRWSSEAVLITDAEGVIQRVNAAFTRLTGYEEAEVLGKTPRILKSEHHERSFYQQMWRAIDTIGVWRGEIWNRRKDGSAFPAWETISAVRDEHDGICNYVGIFSDLTHQKEVQARVRALQNEDALTGLGNRALLHSQLQYATAHASDELGGCALLLIDMDNFKALNDALGHHLGDQAVQRTAERLRRVAPAKATLARSGGDEFALLVEHTRPERLSALAERILAAVAEPVRLQGREVVLSASIGIGLSPRDGRTAGELLQAADTALYRSKRRGPGGYQFHSPQMAQLARRRFSMETDLRRALEREELRLEYQPKVIAGSGRIVGAEALMRWSQHGHGPVPPDQFIAVAEEAGLIEPLGDWALAAACTAAAEWSKDHRCPVAVNLSARQLCRPDLPAMLAQLLQRTGLAPSLLELEVTETALVADIERSVAVLAAVREQGIRLAVDDFGTGYSSLRYLQLFAPDHLKIDKSFIDRLADSPPDRAIVEAVVALGHGLAMRVVAEGVERHAQWQFLRAVGCDELQGYLFGRAMPAERLRARLAKG